jgi:hypothetical protein
MYIDDDEHTKTSNIRSSMFGLLADDFERKSGKKTLGMRTAKQPKTIAKTTVGRAKRDIVDGIAT